MNRKNFIKTIGMTGALAGLSKGPLSNLSASLSPPNACVLIPTETAGPFPLDLTANTLFFRKDLKEDRTGVPLNVKIKVIGANNCEPMSNARVNIWHCDKDGLYSGYDTNQNAGQAGKTYLRGYQFTDANGQVEFNTIFPGWYTGRICHIHFQVYVSTSYSAVSQLTFDIPTKNNIYTSNSNFYKKGADPLSYATDNIFSDGYQYQLASLTANAATGSYDAYLEVTVNGSGTTGMGYIEKINQAQFGLGQNFPNPFQRTTMIPLELKYNSHVTIDLYDTQGKRVSQIVNTSLNEGHHRFEADLGKLSLPSQNYIYQLTVTNDNGVFKDHKMMTSL